MVSDMEKLGIAAIGIMILVVVFGVIPMVGERIDGVADIPTDTASDWHVYTIWKHNTS